MAELVDAAEHSMCVSNPENGDTELWIGIVELRPIDRNAFDYAGAFTTIVTWASDAEQYRKKAEKVAATVDMFVLDVERVEPLVSRIKRETLSEEVEDIVQRVRSNPTLLYFGTFYTYPHSGSN